MDMNNVMKGCMSHVHCLCTLEVIFLERAKGILNKVSIFNHATNISLSLTLRRYYKFEGYNGILSTGAWKYTSLEVMRSLHWSGKHWLETTPSHKLPTQPNTWPLPTWTHPTHLHIAQLICLCVYIHVQGWKFIVILIVDEWVSRGFM